MLLSSVNKCLEIKCVEIVDFSTCLLTFAFVIKKLMLSCVSCGHFEMCIETGSKFTFTAVPVLKDTREQHEQGEILGSKYCELLVMLPLTE